MQRGDLIPLLLGACFLCMCSCEMDLISNVSIKHPVQAMMEEAAKKEPTLDRILLDWDYTKEDIENPLLVKAFTPKGDVVLTWMEKLTAKQVQIGWEQGEQLYPLLMTDAILHIPTPLQTGDEPLGLFVIVKDEVETTFRLDDEKQSTRVYPLMKDGAVVEGSYIICWDVDGDDDFNDVVMQLEGVDVTE